ncbi:MAG: sugar phosphate isomerase/epimerase family protein, partial [Candidatus Acidiferrales bacterium]
GAMQRVLSTYRYAQQPLGASLLSEIAQAELTSVEIYCAPEHFNYRSPEAVREIGGLLGEHGISVHALHSPTERDMAPGRDSGVPISISDTERIRRIDAVDEVKRALEVAERVPFRYLVQQLGNGRQMADQRKTEAAFSSLEHLTIFAKARGVTIALENTPDELGAPAALRHFIQETHLHDLKLCFDAGHAHLEGGVETGFEAMGDLLATTHIHDNHGEKDEHLAPWEGTIDWGAALRQLASAKDPLPIVLELREQAGGTPSLEQIRRVFDKIENAIEARH